MKSHLIAVALFAGCAAKSADQTDGRASEITPAKKPAQPNPSSGDVPEHLGLNVKLPPMAVSEWMRDTDGKFSEQRRQIMLDQVLRDGWVKMIVLEHYSCIPCKVLIETLSRLGPRDADLIVLAVRERDDMDRQDNATREALSGGRGWLVVYRDGVEAMDQIIRRIDRTIDGERFPTLFIVDRANYVRAAATGGETARILRWVGQQVRDAYAADTQPLASLAGVTATRALQVASEKTNKKAAPAAGGAQPIKLTGGKQEGSNAATVSEVLPGDKKPADGRTPDDIKSAERRRPADGANSKRGGPVDNRGWEGVRNPEEDLMPPEDLFLPDGLTEASRLETRRLDARTTVVKTPETKQQEMKSPELQKSEGKRPESKKSEAKKPEPKRAEAKKPEPKKSEAKKPEPKTPR